MYLCRKYKTLNTSLGKYGFHLFYFIHRIGNIHKHEEANVERQIFGEVGAYKDAATAR